MKTLVCLSGGIDSAVVLHMMKERGPCEAVGFNYGQPHAIELIDAHILAENTPFRIVNLGKIHLIDDVVFAGRNLIIASHAISIAASEGFDAIAIGCNWSDSIRFPDCRIEFWNAISSASKDAYGISIWRPLLHMSKAQVVAEALRRGINLEKTWSCYSPIDNLPCHECLACKTREDALRANGVVF